MNLLPVTHLRRNLNCPTYLNPCCAIPPFAKVVGEFAVLGDLGEKLQQNLQLFFDFSLSLPIQAMKEQKGKFRSEFASELPSSLRLATMIELAYL